MAFTKKSTKANTKATKPQTKETDDRSTFYFKGIVDGEPFVGKKYTYLNVKVDTENVNPSTGNAYYNTYSVACDPAAVADVSEGDAVQIVGKIGSFFDRDKKQTVYSFYASEVYGYEDAVDLPF